MFQHYMFTQFWLSLIHSSNKGTVIPVFNEAPCHEGVQGWRYSAMHS